MRIINKQPVPVVNRRGEHGKSGIGIEHSKQLTIHIDINASPVYYSVLVVFLGHIDFADIDDIVQSAYFVSAKVVSVTVVIGDSGLIRIVPVASGEKIKFYLFEKLL